MLTGTFQSALTSGELKLKPKSANIAGLQLADLLGHPVKQWMLNHFGYTSEDLAPFAQRSMGVIESKFNRHLYDQRLEGYGVVLYPRVQKQRASFEALLRLPLRAIHLR